jgi:hypothetical protein
MILIVITLTLHAIADGGLLTLTAITDGGIARKTNSRIAHANSGTTKTLRAIRDTSTKSSLLDISDKECPQLQQRLRPAHPDRHHRWRQQMIMAGVSFLPTIL